MRGLPPGLDNDCADACASGGVFAGFQDRICIAPSHQKKRERIHPKLGKTRRINLPGLDIQHVLPRPQNGLAARCFDRERNRKSRRCA